MRKMSKGTPEEQKRARQEGAEMARRVSGHHKLNRAIKKGKQTTDTRFAQQQSVSDSIDIRAAAVEGLKKVCWGDKHHESMYRPGQEKTVRKEIEKDLAQAKETPQQKRDRERKEMEARKKEFADFYKKK